MLRLKSQSHDYCPVEYTIISTLPISNELDDELASVYTQQLSQEIQLPRLLYPEAQYCGQGYKFNTPNHLTLERTGITIYTENAILEFKDHEGKSKKIRILGQPNLSCINYLLNTFFIVFSSRCNGPCQCRAVFERQNSLLLNINNRYFLHYGLLYEYSELMTKSRPTLYGYLR